MRYLDALRLALRMFKTRPLRTSLTILGVSVGIGAVLFLVSLGYGLQRAILNQIANADTLLTLDVSAGSEALQLTQEALAKIEAVPHIAEISRLENIRGQITFAGINTDVTGVAIDPSFFRLSGMTPLTGTLFDKPDGGGDAVLSTAAVKLLGKTPEEVVGQSVSMALNLVLRSDGPDGATVREMAGDILIGGVVENEDVSELYLPMSRFEGMAFEKFHRLKVKVEGNEWMEGARTAVMDAGYVVSALSDTIDQATKIFSIVQIILGLFGLVALVVSAIGMFNTMTITLLERTNEIGIMRSIGITRKDIRGMFLVESMLMGFLGGLAGLALSTGAGFFVNMTINVLAARFHGPSMDIFYTPLWFMGVVIAFSTVIGFFTGVYPSYRASKLNPLDALRYK
ncbi:MAG: ABC transporter permease [Candidatus Peribacteraceae bacterium]|nr:ABC transporter permease [Candidatus Peribacteraceae bacterium]